MTVEIKNIFYVYAHKNPYTEEIVYIGKGSRGRAWHCAESNSRGKLHADFMTSLLYNGFTPDDWVIIIAKELSEQDAFAMELELINEKKPIYNSKKDAACKMSSEDLQTAFEF